MARLIWSKAARADLNGIRRTIASDSPRNAERVAVRIVEVTRRLEQFPLSGRIVPTDARGERREIIVRPYRVIYRIDRDVVRILTVVHGARLLPELPETKI